MQTQRNVIRWPEESRCVSFDGSPTWMLLLPMLLSCSAILLGLTVIVLLAARWNFSPWVRMVPLVSLAGIVGAVAYRFAELAATRITIDQERLTWHGGIRVQRVISLELFRIQNVEAQIVWWQRPLGFGTLIIESSDAAYPAWVLPGMPQPDQLREALMRYANVLRSATGVQEINFGRV